jgi:hypothetical protein
MVGCNGFVVPAPFVVVILIYDENHMVELSIDMLTLSPNLGQCQRKTLELLEWDYNIKYNKIQV